MIHLIHDILELEHSLVHTFRKLLYSSIYLALGGVGLSIVATIALGVSHNILAYLITFLMIYAMYNMNRYTDMDEDIHNHPKRQHFSNKNDIALKYSSILAVIISLLLGYIINQQTLLLIFLPMLLAILYSFKFIPQRNGKFIRLKDVPLVKNILISFCWTIITVGIVVSVHLIEISKTIFAICFIVFTRLFINTVLFDMRDISGDKKNSVYTLPVLWGVWKTRIFLYSILCGLMLSTVYWIYVGILPYSMHIVNLTAINAFYYVHVTKYETTPRHTLTDVVADGEFKFMGIAALVGNLSTP